MASIQLEDRLAERLIRIGEVKTHGPKHRDALSKNLGKGVSTSRAIGGGRPSVASVQGSELDRQTD